MLAKKDNNKIKIVTHNETFHADDVAGCAILETIFGSDNIILIRSRDPAVIEEADIVVDVGKIYDEENNRFDHHIVDQKYYFDDDDNNQHVMSSVGMIYKKFGREYLRKILNNDKFAPECQNLEDIIEKLYYEFYHRCIKELDLLDNGIRIFKPRFLIKTNLTTIVAVQNGEDVDNDGAQLEKFRRAMVDVDTVFKYEIMAAVNTITVGDRLRRKQSIIKSQRNSKKIFINSNYNISITSNIMMSVMILVDYFDTDDVSVIFASDDTRIVYGSNKQNIFDLRKKDIYIDTIFRKFGPKIVQNILVKNKVLSNLSEKQLDEINHYIGQTLVREFVERTVKHKQSNGSFNVQTDLSTIIADCKYNDASLEDIFNLGRRYWELIVMDHYSFIVDYDANKLVVANALREPVESGRVISIDKYVKNINQHLFEQHSNKVCLIIMNCQTSWRIFVYRNRCSISPMADKDIIFVHHQFFTAGTKTLECAMRLCRQTLEDLDKTK